MIVAIQKAHGKLYSAAEIGALEEHSKAVASADSP
jgi:hypothetical protein